ncbi:MAG: hypothetical protein EOP36_19720 [Rubrivivax sp.]|nr:MAG: hypothetical protein EOP36_19720 [Rubrivivax sp.]
MALRARSTASSTVDTNPSAAGQKLSIAALRKLMSGHAVALPVPDAKNALWPWLADVVAARKSGETPRIEVMNPQGSPHGWLLVVADDQPFLTDTISMAVRRHNPDIGGLWHPVIGVTRQRGKLVTADTGRATSRRAMEAWILVQIDGLNPETVKPMVEDVKQSLSLARAAVRDFEPMRDRMAELTEDFAKGEERSFLQWLSSGQMIILGYRHYDYRTGKKGLTVQATAGTGMGILAEKESAVSEERLVSEIGSLSLYLAGNESLVVSKTPELSRVHRAVAMDYVGVLVRNGKGDVVGEHRFVGLYTSAAYTAEVRTIPLVRAKLASVVKSVNWPQGSYNARALLNVLEMWPRDELFLSDTATLKRLAVATVAVHERPDVCVLVRNSLREGASTVIVYLPLPRMNTRTRVRIAKHLEDTYGTPVREFKVELGDGDLARMVFRLAWHDGINTDEAVLTQDVRALVRGWDDEVQDALVAKHGSDDGVMRWRAFAPLADVSYRSDTPVAVAVDDAAFVSGSDVQDVRLDERDGLHLRMLRRGGNWTLAELMPLVDSCGLKAISEETHQLGDVWVHDVLCATPDIALNEANKAALVAVLHACLKNELEEDSLNRLALGAALGVQEIAVWRAWVAYLQQVDRRLDPRNVRIVVRSRPDLARALWELFEAQHNPAWASARRSRVSKPLVALLEQEIMAMPTAEQERVWRTALGTVLATLRTNVWQPGRAEAREAMAFKLDCAKVPGAAEPRPWREIFVYHMDVEGVHLRGGKVARGGLRHSDRATDYRTEVLGLMTAQMRKNTIIVPVGAKGGFYARYKVVPVEAYKLYIRALLSITDTYDVKGNVIPPRGIVRLDNDDPYLVVAADKGTARYSDTANQLAIDADYWDTADGKKLTGGFWLGDAFATGGSKGYDHKGMGITSRGAWVSVMHHLGGLGLTPSKERPITVVGVGDMSGDVFGNGLLRDKNVQLVAAFNHMHIFIDPNPDPAVTFAERQRMFDASAGWDAYDTKTISKGGGIYLRSAKWIELSAEAQARLGVKAAKLAPEEVVKAILRANADVLWNGGIGTYIKASDEPHAAVADKANDDVRVDATQVRAKVIGEGGNLGISPRGRVELAKRGVQLNTDALDNSAGVDTSDHEVNLKILLQLAMRANKLDEPARVKLLAGMTDDVATLVLRDNAHQNLAISMDGAEDEGYHAELHAWQERLVREGFADPIVDCLPTLRDLKNRTPVKYTRPEMCALLAGTKAWLRTEILKDTDLLDSATLRPLLVWYFPTVLQDKYGAFIEKHPLGREIIATQLANILVNRLGILAVPRLMGDFEAHVRDAVRALGVAIITSGVGSLWRQMDEITLGTKSIMAVSQRLKLVSTVLAAWVLRRGQPVDVSHWIGVLQEPVQDILKLLPRALKGRPEMVKWAEEWASMGLPEAMALRMTLLSPLVIAPDVASLSKEMKAPLTDVLATHLRVGEALRLPALVKKVRAMPVEDAWTRQAVQSMGQEIFGRQSAITKKLVKSGLAVDTWLDGCKDSHERYNTLVREIVRERDLSVAMLSVLLGRLREMEG